MDVVAATRNHGPLMFLQLTPETDYTEVVVATRKRSAQKRFQQTQEPNDIDFSARKKLQITPTRGSDCSQLTPTQEPDYTQDCSAGICDPEEQRYGSIEDVYPGDLYDPLRPPKINIEKTRFSIGRHKSCDLVLTNNRCVGHKHCVLDFDGDGTFTLTAGKMCWVLQRSKNEWETIQPEAMATLCSGQHFRLLPPGKSGKAKRSGVEYRIDVTAQVVEQPTPIPGSNSFDVQYLNLLRTIESEAKLQENNKGENKTLRQVFNLVIDLSHEDRETNLLPLTTLRSLYGGRGALYEAIWYLRGENHIKFLQDNKCHFWDKQAGKKDGFVGLSYGLITNFPQADGPSKNQLEEEVISRLCRGEKSRNMSCTLFKPGETTVQVACTASIQFAVSVDEYGVEALDLTINQRSSDVIVGLPHDVVVWSIILHLVRREVTLRTNGKRSLAAGNLVFAIAQGGAHVYSGNKDAAQTLLTREPKEGTQPYLAIVPRETGMFALARDFKDQDFLVCGYGPTKYHSAIKIKQCV